MRRQLRRVWSAVIIGLGFTLVAFSVAVGIVRQEACRSTSANREAVRDLIVQAGEAFNGQSVEQFLADFDERHPPIEC